MDELTQSLRREFLATGDTEAGARYVQSLLRTSGVQNQVIERVSQEYEVEEIDFIYIGWVPEEDRVRFIVLAKNFELENLQDPPRPKIEEHMEYWERENYEQAWQNYYDQPRGSMHLLLYDFLYALETDSWELETYEYLDGPYPESTTMEKLRNRVYPVIGGTIEDAEDDIEVFNRLHEDINFADELPELEERPVLEPGPCEDYPACGHDICPAYWSTGQQAEMRCVCGASVPIGSRSSLCRSCLTAPDPDDPYGYDDYHPDAADYCPEHNGHVEDCPICEDCELNEHDCECEDY